MGRRRRRVAQPRLAGGLPAARCRHPGFRSVSVRFERAQYESLLTDALARWRARDSLSAQVRNVALLTWPTKHLERRALRAERGGPWCTIGA